jgi:hypothetical protein
MGATSNERTEIDNIDDRVTNNDSKRHVQLIARKGSMESPGLVDIDSNQPRSYYSIHQLT